jgi:hypothetical protein
LPLAHSLARSVSVQGSLKYSKRKSRLLFFLRRQ